MTETLVETPRRWSFSLEVSTVNPDGVRAACSRALVRRPGTFISRSYSGDDPRAHIVVGCVDTRAARATIRDAVGNWSTVSYWLDLGNNADSGQFTLGEPLNQRNRRSRLRLRTAAELFHEIADPNLDNDGEPSCSAVEALERQSPFVNSTLAQPALALLARLFRYGEISYHGGFINLASGATSGLRIDPLGWKRTRRLNKHYTPSRRGQQDAFDVGSSQERVDGSDLRVLSARLRSSEPGRAIQKQLPCATQ